MTDGLDTRVSTRSFAHSMPLCSPVQTGAIYDLDGTYASNLYTFLFNPCGGAEAYLISAV